ncbi:MAG TPA: IS200/IS605 family transposase [Oculatellaceae cyanobacterium]
MSKSNESLKLKSSNNAVYKIYYHVIFAVRYRNKCITPEILQRLKEELTRLCILWKCELVEFGGEADHVHLLVEAYPSLQLPKFVGNIKSVSSRKIRQEFKEHLNQYFWKPYFWSRSYSLFSVGGRAPIEVLLRYIQQQDAEEEKKKAVAAR